ncbi:MAG: discoidin domain-containing protein [Pedobacter sp.]|nr:discoidin domain-containing protein [Pedobacter sp.]
MKIYKLNILAICTVVLLLMACKKEESGGETLAEGRVAFDLSASTDVVARSLDIRSISLLTMEMKAALQGDVSPDVHYVTFATDTTKIADYRTKYGNSALLLPTASYLYYKPTVAIAAGTNVSEAAVLNLSFQTLLKARSSYVLPLTIAAVDGVMQDPKTRKVVYYVFNTGEALYVDHTGYTLTATASSVNGTNVAGRAVDASTLGTYWLSNITQSLPQWVSIDFGRNVTFSGLDYFFPTAVVYATVGGNTTSAKIETSSDNVTWTDKGTYAVDIKNTERKQTLNLPSLTTARYMRFTVLTAAPYVSGGITYSVGFVGGIVLRN